jgi:hypothetical protein
MENARTKVVFSLENEENLRPLAQSLFRGVMSPDKIKLSLYSTKVMGYAEEYRTTYVRSKSEGEGGGHQTGQAAGKGSGGTVMHPDNPAQAGSYSESWSKFQATSGSESRTWLEGKSESESEAPVLIPLMGKELSSVQFEGLEDQLFRAMAVLHDQQQRQFVVRPAGSKIPISLFTPIVESVPSKVERTESYAHKLLKSWPFALRTLDAQKLLSDRDRQMTERFLENRGNDEPVTARRRVRATASTIWLWLDFFLHGRILVTVLVLLVFITT